MIEIEGPTSDVRPVDGTGPETKGTEKSALTAFVPAAILAGAYVFFGLEPSGMAGGAVSGFLLGWPLVAVLVLMVTFVKGRSLAAKRALVHVVVFAIAHGTVMQIADMQRTRAKTTGDLIAGALEQHKVATGRYPDRLGELVPRFFQELPRPQVGVLAQEHFFYARNNDGYVLGFNEAAMLQTRRSAEGTWFTGD